MPPYSQPEKIIENPQDTTAIAVDSQPDPLIALAEKLAPIARQQYYTGVEYRQPKLDAIMKAEEMYYNRVTKTLRGRFNIPLPIVSGFVDTLLSKIDDPISIHFDATEPADKPRARKVTGAWSYDSAPTRGMWEIKDLLVKKLAIFSGRGIYSEFSESDPVYKNYLEIVDAFDFYCESNGGWHLENHLFCGQENIFKTKSQLESGGQYNKAQVEKLFSAVNSNEYKEQYSKYQNHQRRLQQVGLDPQTNNYVGEPIFGLCQHNMTHNGERYYLLFEPISGIWVRIEKLEDITGKPPENEMPRYMFKSWATHYDYWNFWSKAPVDDVVPVASGMKILTNFMFDDFQKKLWGQRIYDAEVIQDPSQLEWDRPDKLIAAVLPGGKRLSDAVYEFQTGDNSSITINLLDYMRSFISLESGVTNQTKGNTDDKILGIAKINAGEVADRLGLTNKFYTQCYAELGAGYISGLKLCMPEKLLVRILGENGTESTEITKEDLEFTIEPDIRITGGKTEMIKNEEKKQAKSNSLLQAIQIAPDLINKKIAAESLLSNGEWDADDITALLDVSADGDEDESVRASQAIQDIIAKKTPVLYQGATERFRKKIYDYAMKKVTKDPALRIALIKYALAHRDIVIENMARAQFTAQIAQNGTGVAPTTPGVTPGQNSNPSASVATPAPNQQING